MRSPKPALRGRCAFSEPLLYDGIEHLRDEALLRFGRACDAFELLLQLGRGVVFAV